MSERAFTVLELLVCLGILAMVGLIGVPSLTQMGGQMSSSDEARHFALVLVSARDEALRLRTDVRVTPTTTGVSIDINADGTVEQTIPFRSATVWDGNSNPAVTFNGLGLARGISSTVTFVLKSKGVRTGVTVNTNGTVSL